MEDFISQYISYTSNTEVPAVFSRWAAITGLGAFLGRQYFLKHGHFDIYPNTYTMLIGSAGTRKGTAIKLMKKLLEQAGYDTFAAERTSKEKFLLDLAGETDVYNGKHVASAEELLDQNLFGDGPKKDCEIFIAIDEFNDFIGNGNIEFISMLGNMWNYDGTYRNRIKTGKSVEIYNPTISIIGGNTPTGFTLAFPSETLGQGFFSRLLLIYGEPNGKQFAFPTIPEPEKTRSILETLQTIRKRAIGEADISSKARHLLTKIYAIRNSVEDVRFDSYSNRRFTHLLKLSLICSAARKNNEVDERDVIYANTTLIHAERFMPKALGEFGKARHSDVSHKIVGLLESSSKILTFKEIWRHVNQDLEKMPDLATLLQNLEAAGKLQMVPEGKGFLPKKKLIEYHDTSMFDSELLTEEERRMTI